MCDRKMWRSVTAPAQVCPGEWRKQGRAPSTPASMGIQHVTKRSGAGIQRVSGYGFLTTIQIQEQQSLCVDAVLTTSHVVAAFFFTAGLGGVDFLISAAALSST